MVVDAGLDVNGVVSLETKFKELCDEATQYHKDLNAMQHQCPKHIMTDELGRSVFKTQVSGEVLYDEDAELWLSSDKVIAKCQRPDKVDRTRARRFIVGTLRDWAMALREGHDVGIGTCLVIKWASKQNFAVVRVLRMYDDDNVVRLSMKLSKTSRKQSFRVEMLVETADTLDGSRRYVSSGWQLGPVAGRMVCRLWNWWRCATFREWIHIKE